MVHVIKKIKTQKTLIYVKIPEVIYEGRQLIRFRFIIDCTFCTINLSFLFYVANEYSDKTFHLKFLKYLIKPVSSFFFIY